MNRYSSILLIGILVLATVGGFSGVISYASAQNNGVIAAQGTDITVRLQGQGVVTATEEGQIYILQGEEVEYKIIFSDSIWEDRTEIESVCVSTPDTECIEPVYVTDEITINTVINSTGPRPVTIRVRDPKVISDLVFDVTVLERDGDFDGDGITNEEEFASGSNPIQEINRGFLTNDPDSSLTILENPLNITTIGLILSIVGILLELRRGV